MNVLQASPSKVNDIRTKTSMAFKMIKTLCPLVAFAAAVQCNALAKREETFSALAKRQGACE